MDWPINTYSINSIFLDSENIRLPNVNQNQEAIIQDLFSNEDALEIAKSYVKNGVYPDEFPIVVRERSKLIVIEGNRRLAALKAIDDPGRIPLFKDKIKALGKVKIQTIKAVLAPNRNAAKAYLASKHTANLRRPWKPLRQAYFYKSQIENGKTVDELIEDFPNIDIPKFIRMLEMHKIAKSLEFDEDDAISAAVHDERKFPITNLERMYEDPQVAEYLGVEFEENGKVKITTTKSTFSKAYKRLVRDVAIGDIDSRKYNNSKQRKSYIDSLPKDLKPKKASGPTFKSESFKEIKPPVKNAKGTLRLKGLIPAYITFKLENSCVRAQYS